MKKEQLGAALAYGGKKYADIAREFGVSRASVSARADRGMWSTEDLEKIAKVMGAEYVYFFRFPDGKEI